MTITLDMRQFDALLKSMKGAGKSYDKAMTLATKRMGLIGQKYARQYVPQDTGALRQSIKTSSTIDQASIFVPSNSEGGSYAGKIHDERYRTWYNLGAKSKQKAGSYPVGEKYIYRAVEDNEGEIFGQVEEAVEMVMAKI